eukprot:768424-Hanusia_phi.AAC.1
MLRREERRSLDRTRESEKMQGELICIASIPDEEGMTKDRRKSEKGGSSNIKKRSRHEEGTGEVRRKDCDLHGSASKERSLQTLAVAIDEINQLRQGKVTQLSCSGMRGEMRMIAVKSPRPSCQVTNCGLTILVQKVKKSLLVRRSNILSSDRHEQQEREEKKKGCFEILENDFNLHLRCSQRRTSHAQCAINQSRVRPSDDYDICCVLSQSELISGSEGETSTLARTEGGTSRYRYRYR